MNVYDFDGTIYSGDSTVDFFLYVLKRNPLLLRYLPKQFFGGILYGLNQIDKTKLKEYFFSFLTSIDSEKLTKSFWHKNQDHIYEWYLKQQKPDDIIISASPEFLLRPICKILGIDCLIASKVDTQSGKFIGENCWGEEKVRRLAIECNIIHIDNFYSDSYSDAPLARIANKAYLVQKGALKKWRETDNYEHSG